MSKGKVCPLLKQDCIEDQCRIYNTMLKTCEISLLSYNLYRLSEVERKRIEDYSNNSQNIPKFPQPKDMDSWNNV